MYLRATHTRRFAGHLVLWTFIVVFTSLWLLSFNGAPPPSVHILVTVDLILFPIVLGWAYWIDRLRQPNETSAHGKRAIEKLNQKTTDRPQARMAPF